MNFKNFLPTKYTGFLYNFLIYCKHLNTLFQEEIQRLQSDFQRGWSMTPKYSHFTEEEIDPQKHILSQIVLYSDYMNDKRIPLRIKTISIGF